MSVFKAMQSFAFYLASCGPCNREMEKRRLKQDAKRQRQEKARERDGAARVGGAIYQQPSAFSTNPYWLEEFNMGPHTNRKKNNIAAKSASQRHLTSACGDTASVGGFSIAATTINDLPNSPNTSNPNNSAFSPTEASFAGATDFTRNPYSGSGSGDSGTRGINANDLTASRVPSRTLLENSRLRDWDDERPSTTSHNRAELLDALGPNAYFDRKNPPVNDLHPPIVRQPVDRSATLWMMAPPPPAKVMSGKGRERADSWTSRRSQNSSS